MIKKRKNLKHDLYTDITYNQTYVDTIAVSLKKSNTFNLFPGAW